MKPSTTYHAKRISFLLVPAADLDNDTFGSYSVNQDQRLNKETRVDWPPSTFVELNEICRRLDLSLDYDEVSGI